MSLSDSSFGLLFFRSVCREETEDHDSIDWSRSDISVDTDVLAPTEGDDDMVMVREVLRDDLAGMGGGVDGTGGSKISKAAWNDSGLIFSSCCSGLGRKAHGGLWPML